MFLMVRAIARRLCQSLIISSLIVINNELLIIKDWGKATPDKSFQDLREKVRLALRLDLPKCCEPESGTDPDAFTPQTNVEPSA